MIKLENQKSPWPSPSDPETTKMEQEKNWQILKNVNKYPKRLTNVNKFLLMSKKVNKYKKMLTKLANNEKVNKF